MSPASSTDRPQARRTRMTCLIIVPSLQRAGAEMQAVNLANGLADKGHAVHLCSFERQLDLKDRLSSRVKFHHEPRHRKYDLSLIGRIADLIDAERIDVVQGVLQFATLVAFLAVRRSRRKPPLIGAVHTTINRSLKEELQDRLLYRRILKRLRAVVFVCEQQRGHWVEKYPELERLSHVVYNGVSPERFQRADFLRQGGELRAQLSIPDEAVVFANVAAFRPEKGHALLLDAFARIRGNAYLMLAGDGERRPAMEAYAAAKGLGSVTRFLGSIPDTRPLIAASNATVLASTAVETFSMAMLESMAMGVPMIAPRIGGLSEAIIDRSTGLLFPVGDAAALTACMQAIIDDPSVAPAMGRAAETLVAERFTVERMAAATANLFLGAIPDLT